MHWKERRVQSHGEFSVSCGYNLFFFFQFLIHLFDHLFSLGFFQQCSKCKHGKYYFFHTSWHHRWTITLLLCGAFYIVPWLIIPCFLIFKTSAGCVLVTGRLMAVNITNAAVTKKTQILSTRANRLRPERPLKNTSSTLRGWVFTSLCCMAKNEMRKEQIVWNPKKSSESVFCLQFAYEQWENHNKSLQLEAQTYHRIQEKIQERVMNNLGTWIDWQYLHNAAKLLAKVLTPWTVFMPLFSAGFLLHRPFLC